MDKYGLIGYPLGHSFSIGYFNEMFQNEGIDAVYENFEIADIDNLREVVDSNPSLRGLNVTIPYKEAVIDYLDNVSPVAREIGAVNVIKVEHKGNRTVLSGHNSDCIGFITYSDITPELVKEYNVIVNCTPVGMFPKINECPNLPYESMDHHTILYDLIYNPDETLFISNGKEHNANVKNGLEMLLLQAFASWEIWNNK